MKFTNVVLALLISAVPPAYAADTAKSASSVQVSNAWLRAPVPGQKTAGGYLEITSARNAALVAANSPAAGRVEIHESTTEGGVMRMRAIPRVELAAGRTVKLAPNGVHLMLFDLKRPLKAGEKVPLTLSVQHAGAAPQALQVELEVRAAASGAHHH
ncbi:MAG TPA: copper chaperone PCu(A)C [Burkholderiales bacterium]|nr:copper chaperone PCu(A)C [Burkholderiales bacterium]